MEVQPVVDFAAGAEGCSGTQPPKDAVYDFAVLAPLAATSAVFGKERNDLLPGFVGNLSASDHTHSSSSRALYGQKLSWVRVFVRQALVTLVNRLER